MDMPAENPSGPFPFGPADLAPAGLADGVRRTLADFRLWRDANPRRVADHVDRYTDRVAAIAATHRLPAAAVALRAGAGRRRVQREELAREVIHFGVLNMAEVLGPATVDAIAAGPYGRLTTLREIITGIDEGLGAAGVVDSLERRLPLIRGLPETRWLADRLDRLHHILPEAVVAAGGMGKAVRAMAGLLVIAALDTLDSPEHEAREHLARVLPAGYAYGAAYAIVDDTLHDLPGRHISAADRQRYGDLIAHALATGERVDPAAVPDHPVAEELHDLFDVVLRGYPFDEYRHLYHAAEAMFGAQHRDATAEPEAVRAGGLATLYPDVFAKAGLSRVVANILARRKVDDGFYARCVNTIFVSQLRDDLIDRDADRAAGRLTPFTLPPDPAAGDPLYDLFAYNAYVTDQVFGGDPVAADALVSYSAGRLAAHLSADRSRAADLLRDYAPGDGIARFLRAASGLPTRVVRGLDAVDQRLKHRVGTILDRRSATATDCRTFVADRLEYVDDVITRYLPPGEPGELSEIVGYAMRGAGKRLRPALTLMLAEALDIDRESVEPVLVASELFHTASLMFDDLPAQDDASVRRGRPVAHRVFDEGGVQLAAVSMISSGFGLIAGLDRWYPPARVTAVIGYLGTVLGPQRLCHGQYLDLRMDRAGRQPTGEEILRMYELKTSTAIEAALVPLLMVLQRPDAEIDLMKGYARHAGIVFQIRDDILDATASTEVLGKDADIDADRINIVRVYGLAEADRLVRRHLSYAVDCCRRLPFDTRLLAGMAGHFATRRR